MAIPLHIKGILLMSGTGSRFESPLPKQFHRLAGKKVYMYALEQFLKTPHFETIILVCSPAALPEVEIEVASYQDPRIQVIAGGSTRQESSLLGLMACGNQTSHVVIHDAVRPFVSKEILLNNIEGAIEIGAVDTCIPSADTIVHIKDARMVASIPNRADYWRGQTPQSFHYPLILNAHLQAKQLHLENISDDCSLIARQNHPIKIILGSEENIKITTELDLSLAEQILHRQQAPESASSPPISLKGKRYAITGGSGGIGKAIATLLEQEGAIPICISRSASYSADLTDYNAVQSTFKQIEQEHGLLDGLINSIGLFKMKTIDALDFSEIQTLIETNFSSVVYICKAAQLKGGAHIVNIASSAYLRGKKEVAVYAGAKSAIVNFSQGLAEEREDVYVNVLIPQRTNTSMRHPWFPEESSSTLLKPQEIAEAILSLLKRKDLTGTMIEVRKTYTPIQAPCP